MVNTVCLTFNIHLPNTIGGYRYFDIGKKSNYFCEQSPTFENYCKKSILPLNNILMDLIDELGEDVKINIHISGNTIDLAKKQNENIIKSLKALSKTNNVEFLTSPYNSTHESFSKIINQSQEIKKHSNTLRELFNVNPKTVFLHNIPINNEITHDIQKLGYEGIVIRKNVNSSIGTSPNYLFSFVSEGVNSITQNKAITHKIQYDFTKRNKENKPITVKEIIKDIKDSDGDFVHLDFDAETFGQIHKEETGIFEFLEAMITEFTNNNIKMENLVDLKNKFNHHNFNIENEQNHEFDCLSQKTVDTIKETFNDAMKENNEHVLNSIKKLTTKENINHLCKNSYKHELLKNHAPYDSQYDMYIAMRNILKDLNLKIHKKPNILVEVPQ